MKTVMAEIEPKDLWSQRFWYRAVHEVPEGTAINYSGRQIGEVVACRPCGEKYEVEARARRDFVEIIDANGASNLELPGF